jgi:hypothetical protein
MLEEIREEFKESLKSEAWMDDSTKPKAIEKLDAMIFEVGYPSEWPEWCELKGLKENTFFENYKKTEVYVCVCVCARARACMCTYVYVCVCVYVYILCTYVYMYMYIYIYS